MREWNESTFLVTELKKLTICLHVSRKDGTKRAELIAQVVISINNEYGSQ